MRKKTCVVKGLLALQTIHLLQILAWTETSWRFALKPGVTIMLMNLTSVWKVFTKLVTVNLHFGAMANMVEETGKWFLHVLSKGYEHSILPLMADTWDSEQVEYCYNSSLFQLFRNHKLWLIPFIEGFTGKMYQKTFSILNTDLCEIWTGNKMFLVICSRQIHCVSLLHLFTIFWFLLKTLKVPSLAFLLMGGGGGAGAIVGAICLGSNSSTPSFAEKLPWNPLRTSSILITM